MLPRGLVRYQNADVWHIETSGLLTLCGVELLGLVELDELEAIEDERPLCAACKQSGKEREARVGG